MTESGEGKPTAIILVRQRALYPCDMHRQEPSFTYKWHIGGRLLQQRAA
jgi:hypothetical protein